MVKTAKVMGTCAESREAVRSQYGEILDALLNCSEFEQNSLVREESQKCMIRMLEGLGDLIGAEQRLAIQRVSQSLLSDQSNQVKQNAAAVLGQLLRQTVSESEKTDFIQRLMKELQNVSKSGDMASANENQFIPNYIAKPSPILVATAKKRFVAEHFEGIVAMVKETAYAIGKEKSQISEELCQLILYNIRNICFDKNENIKENIWVMLSEILCKTMNKKNVKDLIEDILDPVFRDFHHEKHNLSLAAKELVRDLAKFIGPNILKGRIEMHGDISQLEEFLKLSLL